MSTKTRQLLDLVKHGVAPRLACKSLGIDLDTLTAPQKNALNLLQAQAQCRVQSSLYARRDNPRAADCWQKLTESSTEQKDILITIEGEAC